MDRDVVNLIFFYAGKKLETQNPESTSQAVLDLAGHRK